VAALFPLAAAPFATVHPGVRGGVALVAGGVATAVLVSGRATASRLAARLATLSALAVALQALALVPVGPEGRARWQPGFAPIVDRALALAGSASHPLALDPRGALLGLAFAAAMIPVAVASACLFTTPAGGRVLAAVLGGTGVGLTLLAWTQWATGAPSIGWASGVGGAPLHPFFATFVNVNHGATACAILVPVVLGQLERRRGALVAGAAAVLLAGVWSSASRGAVLAAALGVAAFGTLGGPPRIRWLSAAASAIVLVVVWTAGPRLALTWVTGWVDPAFYSSADVFSGRLELWRRSLEILEGAPWVGVGGGGFDDAFQVVKRSPRYVTVEHAHQDLLHAGAEHGLPSLLAWLVVVLGTLGTGAAAAVGLPSGPHRRQLAGWVAAGTALLGVACVDFPMHIGALAVLAALIGGATVGMARPPTGCSAGAPAALAGGSLAVALLALWLAAATRGGAGAYGDSERSFVAGMHARALGQRPLHVGAMLALARSTRATDPDTARSILGLAGAASPTLPWPWLALARLELETGDAPAAWAAWRRMLALDAPADDAIEPYLREALRTDPDAVALAPRILPDRPDRWCRAAAVVAGMRRRTRAQAEAMYRRATATDPSCNLDFAVQLQRWGRHAEALALAESLPRECAALRTRGYALLGLDRPEEAIPLLEEALVACASDHGVRRFLAAARLRTADPAGLAILEALVSEDPDDVATRRDLCAALLALGRREAAIPHLQALVELNAATNAEKELLSTLRPPPNPR
jgi:O-antigen ligase/tetratricopeptide (TPR) repeat protein